MELKTFIGTWINKAGNRLEIRAKDNKSLNVSFFTQENTPVLRETDSGLDIFTFAPHL